MQHEMKINTDILNKRACLVHQTPPWLFTVPSVLTQVTILYFFYMFVTYFPQTLYRNTVLFVLFFFCNLVFFPYKRKAQVPSVTETIRSAKSNRRGPSTVSQIGRTLQLPSLQA